MADTLRSTAHLQKKIGDELFAALISSDNTDAVRKFAVSLIKDTLPTTLTIGGRVYDTLSFLRGNEKSVRGSMMIERAKEVNAHSGNEEGEHFLNYQGDIPKKLRGKVAFVFTDWRVLNGSERVYCVDWSEDSQCWDKCWGWLDEEWTGYYQVLHRVS